MKSTLSALFLCAIAPTLVRAQSTALVSTYPPGHDSLNWQHSTISADGRYIAFVFDDEISYYPVIYSTILFLWDGSTGTLHYLGSHQASPSESEYWTPLISGDGRFLAEAHTSGGNSYHRQAHVLSLPSGAVVETLAADLQSDCVPEAISFDGRFVAFYSNSPLIAGNHPGLFVRDRLLNLTERLDVSSTGVISNGLSGGVVVSDDGRFAGFVSNSTNLVPAASGAQYQAYVRDRANGTIECVSVDMNGMFGNGTTWSCSISSDGRFVAFDSDASNLVPNDTNGVTDVFVRDRMAGVTRRVSLGLSNAQANGRSHYPSMSADGRFVAFDTAATNMIANVSASHTAIVRDRTWDRNELAAITTPGFVSDYAVPRISATGQFVVYQSADNIYRWDRGPTLHRTYCTGDGQAAACPCGNASPFGSEQGCLNSLGMGARLDITGSASVTNDSLVLLGSGMPDSAALYFQGSSPFAGGVGAPFGDGLRCAGGTLFRFTPKLNMGGSSAYPLLGDPSISVQGNVTTPGSRFYQVRYRNSASFCTSDTFNTSNGIEVVWGL